MALPQQLPIDRMQNQWAAQLNPLIANPINQANILTDVVLKNGSTVVNHKLGRMMQGWFIVDQTGAAQIYRSASMNSVNITLTSNAAVTVALAVF